MVLPGMILHRDDRGFRIQRAVGIAQPQHVGKLQRRGAGKQNFSRCPKFDDGAFLDAHAVWLVIFSNVVAAVN